GFGRMAKAVFKIGGDGKIGSVHDHARVGECFVACKPVVALADGDRSGGAGGGERLESQSREDVCGADVPRIRDDETGTSVEFAEAFGLFSLCGRHKAPPRPIQSNPFWSGRRRCLFRPPRATPVLRRKARSEGVSNLWWFFFRTTDGRTLAAR